MIDWKRVDELREEIGAEDFTEVVQLFVEEVEEVMNALRAGPDLARLGGNLHFLKGSALNLGFRALGAQCQQGERDAAAGRAAKVDLHGLIACYDTSKKQFLAGVDRRAASDAA